MEDGEEKKSERDNVQPTKEKKWQNFLIHNGAEIKGRRQ